MNSSLKSPYFLTFCFVYLFDSAFKRILVNYNSTCSLYFFIFVVLFSRIMFFKLHFFYFVLFAKANGFCLRAQAVNSDFILNVLETIKFVFCLQLHALAKYTMNSKFCILHSTPAASCSIQNFSFIIHLARACICKQNTHNSL